jgi:hypothetical protein
MSDAAPAGGQRATGRAAAGRPYLTIVMEIRPDASPNWTVLA